ncbi:uncharacterized protein LOC128724759 [Anopheles nili]|uniref:uncharacterized protein LOC128724759 n=1 Tax=Anopheles nili TaxID=185578 RepID=UPI00237BBC4A|nr:uncharacterized protein LOC128724759 [Anopheles nili]
MIYGGSLSTLSSTPLGGREYWPVSPPSVIPPNHRKSGTPERHVASTNLNRKSPDQTIASSIVQRESPKPWGQAAAAAAAGVSSSSSDSNGDSESVTALLQDSTHPPYNADAGGYDDGNEAANHADHNDARSG